MRYAVVLALVAAGACSRSAPRVRVAAASDLAKAFTELATEFKTRTGIAVELKLGSSGQLAREID